MSNVAIVAGARTPIGYLGGAFKTLTALDLSIPVLQALVERGGFSPERIDDVIWGCNYQRTYKENNLARVALVKAGLPVSVPGITIHRNCTSSMSSVQLGYYQIKSGEANMIVAGGSDSMSTAPHVTFDMRSGKKFGDFVMHDSMWDSLTNLGIGPPMGITAENIAERYKISREDQDEYALLSQHRAADAIDAGRFKDEIIPVTVRGEKDVTVDTDEYPRRDITIEGLQKLRATFKESGTVTAGNASGMNDAASGIVLADEDFAKEQGIPVLGRVLSTATVGVDPEVMGIGPVDAVKKVLAKAQLNIGDIGLFEINEAFASQCIACERELCIDRNILNVNGGGISLGHPVGATGTRIIITLLFEMRRRGVRYGVASLCAGGGMGTAVVIEA
jgi:acetyl-CoA C-acetyltransferase